MKPIPIFTPDKNYETRFKAHRPSNRKIAAIARLRSTKSGFDLGSMRDAGEQIGPSDPFVELVADGEGKANGTLDLTIKFRSDYRHLTVVELLESLPHSIVKREFGDGG